MPNNANPAWQGGARQKVSFSSNGSADNKELISDTQACRRAAWSHPGRVTIALSTVNAWAPLRDRRDDLPETPSSSVTPCSSAIMIPNVVQRGDALTLLRSLSDSCTPLAHFDPQYRGVLDHLQYGNKGSRQRGRAGLPAMTKDYIDACCRETARDGSVHKARTWRRGSTSCRPSPQSQTNPENNPGRRVGARRPGKRQF